ncbi:MAG: L,D-transpeptidase family protein [Lachnospiraceae bacterium]|nr:L,D-transpeptidase family protein [Lachnospiraceae bacterium]
MSTAKKSNRKHKGLMIAGFIFLISLTVYLGIAVFFSKHFLPGTTINGVSASGKTIKAVERLITEEIDGYQIELEPREGTAEVIQGTKIGLRPVFDGRLEVELKKQKEFFWPAYLFGPSEIEVETMVEYDRDALQKEAKNLELMDESQMRKAENAIISEYSEKDGYTIIPEEEGTVVDEEKFFEVLEKSVLNLQDQISLAEEECYVKPKYTSESKKVVKLAETMNQYVKTSITYDFGDSQEVLNGKTISQWISSDKKYKAKISQEKIEEYIANLADTYNTAGRSKKLKSSYGTEVTVSGGDYGWKMDKEAEAEALKEHIKKGEVLTKEPAYSQTANSRAGNDYGDTYVEVNLTAQHMYYYKNGSLVVETDFVSGNDAKGWSTPPGAFGLYYKQRDKTLRGEGYATPVSFWMPFNGGVGFHDANWRRDFGGNYYKRGGSHGCVNMPYLGEVTLESKEAVVNARNQYNGLDGSARGYVSNYGSLEAAEARIAQLEAEAAADQQAQAEAQPVIDAINQLAGQEITLEMKGTIEKIRKQYNGLSEAARAKVGNYNVLTEAEQRIEELKKAEKEQEEE